MKKIRVLGFILFAVLISGFAQAQSVTGKWITVDDNSGKERSVIEIYEKGGKIYGKIIEIFDENDRDEICTECDEKDPRYKKPVLGMEIMKDLEKDGKEYNDGNILDPENGKIYDCKIWRDGENLKVRGYVAFFYRTQTWKPYKK